MLLRWITTGVNRVSFSGSLVYNFLAYWWLKWIHRKFSYIKAVDQSCMPNGNWDVKNRELFINIKALIHYVELSDNQPQKLNLHYLWVLVYMTILHYQTLWFSRLIEVIPSTVVLERQTPCNSRSRYLLCLRLCQPLWRMLEKIQDPLGGVCKNIKDICEISLHVGFQISSWFWFV